MWPLTKQRYRGLRHQPRVPESLEVLAMRVLIKLGGWCRTAKSGLDTLSGWCRAAFVFSALWCGCVVAVRVYERCITIGDTSGPWVFFRDYGTLIFYHVEIRADQFSFWLLSQRFWTVLLVPVFVLWTLAGLAHTRGWIRRGFQN